MVKSDKTIVIGWPVIIVWLMGVVIAKGFWSTLVSVVFPPWSFYLVVEKLMQVIGWV